MIDYALQFEHVGKVVGKGRPRFAHGGHAYTPAATRAASDNLASTAIRAMAANAIPLMTGPLWVVLEFFSLPPKSWPAKTRASALNGELANISKPDIDNAEKLVLDALTGTVWADDKQVVSLMSCKRYAEVEATRVTVGAASPQCFDMLWAPIKEMADLPEVIG